MKKKILIVEDEMTILNILSDKFKKEGFDVWEAKNGEDGLVMALEKKPDLILLDVIMPVMDGITMLQKLREDKWGEKASIFILSNLADEARVKESIQSGVTDYLIKSDWKIEDLVKKVKKKLKI